MNNASTIATCYPVDLVLLMLRGNIFSGRILRLTALIVIVICGLASISLSKLLSNLQILQGQTATFTPRNDGTGPGSLTWLILKPGGTDTAGSSETPNGWTVTCNSSTCSITVPQQAPIGVGYSMGYSSGLSHNHISASEVFDVVLGNAPGAPTNLTATAISHTVTLGWTAPQYATSYTVYRSTSSNPSTFSSIGTCTTTGYVDNGLNNGTIYFYYVTATDSIGTGPASSTVNAEPLNPPSPPTGLTGTPANNAAILSWQSATGATSYNIYRSSGGSGLSKIGTTSSTTYTDNSAANGTLYSYGVTALNAMGESAVSSQVAVQPPGPPSAPILTAATGLVDSVGLSWTATGSLQTTGYNIYRSTSPTTGFAVLASIAGTAYTDSTCPVWGTYYYKVNAYGLGGPGPFSNVLSAIPGESPVVPTGLTAAGSSGQVALQWNASPHATSYSVLRQDNLQGAYNTIATGVSSPSFIDTNVSNFESYSYEVAASNSYGTSANSGSVQCTPGTVPAAPVITATGIVGSILVNWSTVLNASTYNLYRTTIGGNFDFSTPYASGLTGTNYGDPVAYGVGYSYILKAVNSFGEGPPSLLASATSAYPQEQSLTLSGFATSSTFNLSWTGEDALANSYSIYETQDPNQGWGLLANTTQTSYQVTGASRGILYYFCVTAHNAQNESAPSNTVSLQLSRTNVPWGISPNNPLGFLPDALTTPAWFENSVPTDSPAGGDTGAGSFLSVNLASGVVDADTGADAVAKNLTGGDVEFGLHYRTALAQGHLSSPGLPYGWTHNWDLKIVPVAPPGGQGVTKLQLVYANGASETLVPEVDANGVPTGALDGPFDLPFKASGTLNDDGSWATVTLKENGLAEKVFTRPILSNSPILRLSSVIYGSGQGISLGYDQNSELVSIDDLNGSHLLSMNYPNGYLAAVSRYNYIFARWDQSATYSYAGDPNGGQSVLASVGRSGTPEVTTFGYSFLPANQYESCSFLSTVNEPNPDGIHFGHATVDYDPTTGRAYRITDGVGNQRVYKWNDVNGTATTSILKPSMDAGVYPGNLPPTSIEASEQVAYDFLYREISASTDGQSATDIDYSLYRDESQVRYPIGDNEVITYVSGFPTSIQHFYSGDIETLVWETPADAPMGRLHSRTRLGVTTTYTYYSSGDADGPDNFVQSVQTDGEGTYTYKYTSLGDIKSIVGPSDTNPTGAKTVFCYDSPEVFGQPREVREYTDPTFTNYLKTSYTYDAQGNVTSVTDPSNNTVQNSFNSRDQLVTSSVPYKGGTTQLGISRSVDGLPATSVQVTGSDGILPVSGPTFDANNLVSSDEAGAHSYGYAPNARGELRAFSNGNSVNSFQFSDSSDGTSATSIYGQNSKAIQWNATLDALGQPTDLSLPGEAITRHFNWANGKGVIDADGLPASFDAFSSEAHLSSWFDLAGNPLGDEFDQDRQPDDQNHNKVFTKVNRGYGYDSLNRIKSVTTQAPVGNAEVDYTYSPTNGNVDDIVLGSQPNDYHYNYDSLNRVTGITFGGRFVASYAYDVADSQLTVTTPDVKTIYTYDNLGNITDQLSTAINSSVILAHITCTYDSWGNRTGINYNLAGRPDQPDGLDRYSAPIPHTTNATLRSTVTSTFGYDQNERLTSEGWSCFSSGITFNSVNYSHEYDGNDNLTKLRGRNWTVDTDVDQLTAGTSLYGDYGTIGYDHYGQLSAARNLALNYSQLGTQLSTTTQIPSNLEGGPATANTKYAYDAEGHRIARTTVDTLNIGNPIDSPNDYFCYSGDQLLFRHLDSRSGTYVSGAEDSFYVWGPTGPVVRIEDGQIRSLIFDPNGNLLDEYSTGGGNASMGPFIYDGYGLPVWPSQDVLPLSVRDGLGYKGQAGCYTDAETGLVYCHHRYYDPESGRWTSLDPIGLEGGANSYTYCDGNPIMLVDPSGLDGFEWTWGGFFHSLSTSFYIINSAEWDMNPFTMYWPNPYKAGADSAFKNDEGGVACWWLTQGALACATGAGGGETAPAFGLSLRVVDGAIESAVTRGVDELAVTSWQQAEKSLARSVGGVAQKRFTTNLGGARIVDQFADGIIHEAKYGRQTLSVAAKGQIAKDLDILHNNNSVTGIIWHFWRNGSRGPTQSLLNFLSDSGIPYIIHQ